MPRPRRPLPEQVWTPPPVPRPPLGAPDLASLAPATLRLLLASLCAAPDSPLGVDQRAGIRDQLRDLAWRPSWATCPVSMTTVAAWLRRVHTDVPGAV